MDQIKELKVEIFDILATQDHHKMVIQQLEQLKQEKLKTLNELLSQKQNDKPVEDTKEEN